MASRPMVKRPTDAGHDDGFPPEYQQFKAGLQIDRDDLDTMVQQQAALFHEVFERHILAVSLRDDKAKHLSERDAEIAREFRRQQEAAKEKCTEAMTNDAVLLHPEHQRIKAEFDMLKRNADLWYSLREAYDQRVKMLHELVALHSAQYFGSTAAGTVGSIRDAQRREVAKEELHKRRLAKHATD